MTLSRNRPVRTRDGREVTIYTWDAPGLYPIHGHIKDSEIPSAWTATGSISNSFNAADDLVQPPQTVVQYCDLYRRPDSTDASVRGPFDSVAQANADVPIYTFGGWQHISRRRVEFTEGQFDE